MKAACSVLLILVALVRSATCLFMRKHVDVNLDLNWTEAQTYCRSHYVDLFTISTQEEYEYFRSNFSVCTSKHCWIGLSKRAGDNNFTQWSDGSMLGFTKWASGEPNSLNTELCANSINAEWYNCNCSFTLNFLCYTSDEPRVIVVQEMKTWMEALEHCRKFYTDLISLNTENDLLLTNNRSLSIQTPSVWIGLRFLDGSWFWVNKEPLGNLIQLPLCPARPRVCGARKVGENVWENRDCEEKMNFICYHR